MKADILDLNGKVKTKLDLPKVFEEKHRPDIIKRAYLAIKSHKRQSYGSDPMAGLRTAANYRGKRRERYTMMNVDRARRPRLTGTSPHLMWRVRRIPSAVKGRRAHPPMTNKKWGQKINDKERLIALKSSMASTINKDLVESRGHVLPKLKLPIVVDNKIQKLKKTKDVEDFLKKLGLEKELERVKGKKVRSGKGKIRGRKYKRKVGPLILITEDKGICKATKNIAGVDVRDIKNVSVDDLAPGSIAGRLVVYSKSAIEYLKGN